MNNYATLSDIKAELGITGTSDDTYLLQYLEAASRQIDDYTKRYFFTKTATLYYDVTRCDRVLIDDCLAISAATADYDDDRSYSETWTENTDFELEPFNEYPKTRFVWMDTSTKSLTADEKYLKLVGTFGYGDGVSASPWLTTAITGTVATAGGLSLTLSATGTIVAGQTIKCESEQMYVSAVSSTTATVERGVNGTTAAAHTGQALSIAKYPNSIILCALRIACAAWNRRGKAALSGEVIGNYQYTLVNLTTEEDAMQRFMSRILGTYRKLV